MKSNFFLLLTCIACAVLFAGCPGSTDSPDSGGTTSSTDDGHNHSHDEHAGHDHSGVDHTPPHGGHLIELGRNHEYHAELVHDSSVVSIYIMDSHMESLAVNQSSVTLILTSGDETQTFELLASQPGGSDLFSSSDSALLAVVEGEVTGKLRVTIDGKPFSGTFEHHAHDHESSDSHAGHSHD